MRTLTKTVMITSLFAITNIAWVEDIQPWIAIDDHTGQVQFHFEIAGEPSVGSWSVVNAANSTESRVGDFYGAEALTLYQTSQQSLAAELTTSTGIYQGFLKSVDANADLWAGVMTNASDQSLSLSIEPDFSSIPMHFTDHETEIDHEAGIDYAEFSDFWILYDSKNNEPLARIELLRGDSADAGGFYQLFDTVNSPLGVAAAGQRSDVKVKDEQLIGQFPTDDGAFTLFMEVTGTMPYVYSGGLRLAAATQDIIPVYMQIDTGRGNLPPVPKHWEISSGVNISANHPISADDSADPELGEPLGQAALFTCQQPRCWYTSASNSPFLADIPLLKGWSVIEESSFDAMPQLSFQNFGKHETIQLNPTGEIGDDLACFRLQEGGDDLLCQSLSAQDNTVDMVNMISQWRQSQLDANLGAELYNDI